MEPLMSIQIKKLLQLVVLFLLMINAQAQVDNTAVAFRAAGPAVMPGENYSSKTSLKIKSRKEYILAVLDVFGTQAPNEIYQLTIAADVPDNKRPSKVFYKKEPGHVFLILEKRDTVTNQSVAKVWGFYPVRPVSCLLFRKAKSVLTDNGNREYDASITKRLSVAEFNLVKLKAAEFAEKKYHINKYNCYDYAVEIFNAVAGAERLPVTHIKFPLIFGRGGSPCSLYADLVKIKDSNSGSASTICIGNFKAPKSKISSAEAE